MFFIIFRTNAVNWFYWFYSEHRPTALKYVLKMDENKNSNLHKLWSICTVSERIYFTEVVADILHLHVEKMLHRRLFCQLSMMFSFIVKCVVFQQNMSMYEGVFRSNAKHIFAFSCTNIQGRNFFSLCLFDTNSRITDCTDFIQHGCVLASDCATTSFCPPLTSLCHL